MNKKSILTVCLIIIAICFAGCGTGSSTSNANVTPTSETVKNTSTPTPTPKPFVVKDAIKIEEIEWSAQNVIVNGQRYLALTYTNNSEYTIVELDMEFTQKEPLTDEQKLLFSELQEHLEYWEQEFTELHISGRNLKMADPGEMVGDRPLTLNGTGIEVVDMEQFALVEPDMMTILFLGPDDKVYELYYDFKTQIYGESSEGGLNVHQTSENPLAALLPEWEFRANWIDYDDEEEFELEAYGILRDEFDRYVEAVKSLGFILDSEEEGNGYQAYNSDGICITVVYNAMDEIMEISVEVE